jgi:hypothetical protein
MSSTRSTARIGSLGPLKALVVGAVLVWAAATTWLVWTFHRPPIDLDLLEQLRPGMSSHEVHSILGAPRSRLDAHWVYARPLSWPIVYVYFDENERFHRSRYDD